MSEWQPIESAPKEGVFMVTDGVLLGTGSFYRRVEPETKIDYERWRKDCAAWEAAHPKPDFYSAAWTPADPHASTAFQNSVEWGEADRAAMSKVVRMRTIPNPKAGQVNEGYYASAFHAFDGKTETEDHDGPVGFEPTHWMPLPAPPA